MLATVIVSVKWRNKKIVKLKKKSLKINNVGEKVNFMINVSKSSKVLKFPAVSG